MTAGIPYSEAVRAEAIKRYLEGESQAAIARSLGVPSSAVRKWIYRSDPVRTFAQVRQAQAQAERALDPAAQGAYRRDLERISDLIYDVIVETLESLRARATETGRAEWIQAQTAADIANLDAAHWDRIIRMLSAFSPAEGESRGALEAGDAQGSQEPEAD
jgi:transposase